VREYVIGRLTSGRSVDQRNRIVDERRRRGEPPREPWLGLNLAFTKDGMKQLLGANRPRLDPSFERGADNPETIEALNDPPPAKWVPGFVSDRIDAVFLITGPNPSFVTYHGNLLGERLGATIKPVYSEIGTVRPGRQKGHEHFGFRDGISQPGIRGLTRVSRPTAAPNQGLPGQDLVWPGEFILGYPGQDPLDAVKPGPVAPLPAPWARNGSYMVFRRLEQRVPEFRAFAAAQAVRLGMIGNCWRHGWSGVGAAARRWSWRRSKTRCGSGAMRGGTTTSATPATPFSARAPMPHISASRTRAMMCPKGKQRS